ncbi:hypothetical protein JTB14_032191 [Gonioctena quinquepunctata]|nr:hypothetical protein JTB14_032191 [Gonioctena quinquepunctata]
MNEKSIEVVVQDLKAHPCCPHGPTILFSRQIKHVEKQFYACAACRDRKYCNFFLLKENETSFKKGIWQQESENFLRGICHRKKYSTFQNVYESPAEKRLFCHTCEQLLDISGNTSHQEHHLQKGLTDYQLRHPSELLPPLENSKKEAQYLFSRSTVATLVDILGNIGYKHIICIGTPRIHEYIQSERKNFTSILLDMDKRFHNFFGLSQYCWYNMFNHHFFFEESQKIFMDYLKTDNGKDMVLVTDPPFGGRTELLAQTFSTINQQYKTINNNQLELPIFWIYPYFMEPQILNYIPNFHMLDFKVEYDNHPLFQNGPKGRKQGSPVRIFTNVNPRLVKLPAKDYKYCELCDKWVANENQHCDLCNSCTSKNGVTYVHCSICTRCVKPTWKHCKKCGRCAQIDHKCIQLAFTKDCFNCKKPGHRRIDCPQLKEPVTKKQKLDTQMKNKKKRKLKKGII